MIKNIENIVSNIYNVPYWSGTESTLIDYIKTIRNFIDANHFINYKNYLTNLNVIEGKLGDLGTSLLERENKFLYRTIQKDIAFLARKVLEENKKIFIVHGRNIAMRDKVSSLLGRLKIDWVVLESEHNAGSTVIEKFIRNAEECRYAIIIFSSDDVGKFNSENEKLANRTRQNVILEMGYFLANVGRRNLFILHEAEKNIENPSDFNGIVYEPFDEFGAWKNKLIKEMKRSGIYIDPTLADRI